MTKLTMNDVDVILGDFKRRLDALDRGGRALVIPQNMKEDLIHVLAEQAYRIHLLTKLLVEHGHLKHGEVDSHWDKEEHRRFVRDFYGTNFSGVAPPHE